MLVVLAGASGFLGPRLRKSLTADGHDVRVLVRRAPTAAGETRWDPAAGELDAAVLDGADAVVCLSGVGVGDHRWNAKYKQEIVDSRVDSVGTIARTMAAHGGPGVLVSASAVGYYGDGGDRTIDESASPGDTFLADVCVKWEAAADPARAAGIRVAHPRTGYVVARSGGLMGRLKPIFQVGIGGKLGSGRQYFPWISVTDEIAALRFLLEHDVAGPVNLTGPAPVTNAAFTKALGAVLHRPTIFPVPAFALRTVLGEFAGEVLIGQNAVPAALLDAGFTFAHPDVDTALRAELG